MLPVRKPVTAFSDLDQLRQRKEQLSASLQHDNEQFSTLWHELFVPKKDSSKSEWVTGLVSNGITAIDTFLLVRKLMKNYGSLFRRGKK